MAPRKQNKRRRKRRRRPTKAQRQRRWKLVSFALALLASAVLYVLDPIGSLDSPPPRDAEHLRVVSWNLENFRGDPEDHDLERLRQTIEAVDPDILAVQEIKDPEALAALLPGWGIALSKGGGRGHQKLGVAWRRDRVELVGQPVEHRELTLSGRVRPAFSAYFRDAARSSASEASPPLDLWVTVVHLKAMPTGHEDRTTQWPALVEAVRGLSKRDPDHVVLGDFNSTGAPGEGTATEHAELDAALRPADLRRLPNSEGCSAYYDGARRDAWKEASEIDLVWVRGLEGALGADPAVHSGTHCAAHHCRDFRSTEAYPEPDYSFLSDHCPVILDLRRGEPDGPAD
ncbi:hypothetical protein PPSIR1_41059 [Plesiocystis pacifica SIR-1]|uniref:Endonuclease/exonuclease/phosphatase domain-containing protein n=1 Tax=Plesiocystis pacifica SIR-1 TaxID=391625 RepID=A6GG20_9BACT|nr:endonuclease/exonuclease/phosphatase family protein [Plesiocystis pacifica]EDM75207.1 hypothetical protein PPSIR1_41059 [Plesiocystis pacifica SIR-1]